MKTLLMLLMMVVLVACNGAGGGSAGDAGAVDAHTDKIITYNSYGVFQVTGVSMDQMGTFDEHRGFVIPETLSLIQDSNHSVQVNDVARIIFVQSNCDYKWNGVKFYFQSCSGALASGHWGDVVYLYDIRSVPNPQMNGIIQMGVIRPAGSNHTGNIVINANLQ